jgi:hypothetical protein
LHTVAEAQQLQITLGKIRKASGHYLGELIALDPHRVESFTKRQMRKHKESNSSKNVKVSQTFFAIDAETKQPICFTIGSAARTVTQATPELLQLSNNILNSKPKKTLAMVDAEHYTVRLLEKVKNATNFDMLLPIPNTKSGLAEMKKISEDFFVSHWAGYATAQCQFKFKNSNMKNLYQLVQRFGEKKNNYNFNRFLSTRKSDVLKNLTINFPKRWHIEEFFNKWQDVGWKRAGTMNLNIRYGQMTMALIAQAAMDQLQKRIGKPADSWNAKHFATELLAGLDGDIRVIGDTIVVTYYNAPNADKLKKEFENISNKLASEGIKPQIPWLYNFKLDFRFK